jgi:outer membrane protein OmpA-like peptidoglycan-associated protein
MKHIIRSATGALVAGMIAVGCSTSPPAADVAAANTAIGNAGQAIDQAAADPHVAKYAQGELDGATDSLQKAKAVWNEKHDVQATTQLASAAQQRATAAQELANGRAAEDAAKVAAAERERAAAAEQAATPVAAPPAGEAKALAGFAFGAAKLPADAMPAIDELATNLKNNPGRVVVIEGHTDNVGSPDYNLTLAMQRAKAVRAALVRHGVESGRITIQSLGEQNPVASNDSSEGRRENRRAQVMIGGTQEEARMVGSSQGSTSATSSGAGEQSGQPVQSGQTGQTGQTGQSGQTGQTGQTGQSGQNGQSE